MLSLAIVVPVFKNRLIGPGQNAISVVAAYASNFYAGQLQHERLAVHY